MNEKHKMKLQYTCFLLDTSKTTLCKIVLIKILFDIHTISKPHCTMNKTGSKTGHLEIKMKMYKYDFFDIFPLQYNIS